MSDKGMQIYILAVMLMDYIMQINTRYKMYTLQGSLTHW